MSLSRWLFTTSHKDVGRLYIVTSLYFGFLGSALSLLIRTQLAFPGESFLVGAQYDQAVTVHGLLMVLWFLSPLAFGFANYFVPLQIGAKDLAFPRLNAMSYWLYLFSGILAALGFFVPGGAIATGWTVYAPLSSTLYSPGLGTTLGGAALLMLIGSMTASTVNFLTTIVWMRAPGMTFTKLPMFTWFVFLTVVMMLWAFPAIFAGVAMLALDRILGTTWFSAAQGGALLWDNIFWFFGHPEVYIVLFPSLGAILDIIPHFAHKPLFARKTMLVASGVAAVMSMIVYGHHMYLTPIALQEKEYYTVVTEAISLPFAVLMASIIGTLYRARAQYATPMLFAVGSPIMFVIGGITGVFNSSVALDHWFRGTYWVVGHFHYILAGTAVFGMLAAAYYWWPKLTGKMYSETLGKVHFLMSFAGVGLFSVATSLLIDMPRRVFTYPAGLGWGPYNLAATIGAAIALLGQLVFVANLLSSLMRGSPSGPNPWGATAPEWTSPLTAAPGASISLGQPLMAYASGGAVGADHLSGRPVTLSLGLFLLFVGLGFLPILVSALFLLAYSLVGWAYDDLRGRFRVPDEAEGERWPVVGVPKVKLGVWVFLASDIIFFSTLFGSYAFVRYNSLAWPAAGTVHNIAIGTANTLILLTSGLVMAYALWAIRAGNRKGLLAGLVATFGLASLFLGIKAYEWSDLMAHGFTFSSGLPAATYFTITGAHALHVGFGLLLLTYLIVKTTKGGFTRESHAAVENFTLYWALVDIIWLIVFPLFYLM